jgi:hypothetical protein
LLLTPQSFRPSVAHDIDRCAAVVGGAVCLQLMCAAGLTLSFVVPVEVPASPPSCSHPALLAFRRSP